MGVLSLFLALGSVVQAFPNKVGIANNLVPRDCSVPGPGSSALVASCVFTSVNSAGQTVISDSDGAVVLSTGVTVPIVATFPGHVTTITPSTLIVATINSAGQTVISDASATVTLPKKVSTTFVTKLPNGETTTILPAATQASINAGSSGPSVTVSNGQTTTSAATTLPVTTQTSIHSASSRTVITGSSVQALVSTASTLPATTQTSVNLRSSGSVATASSGQATISSTTASSATTQKSINPGSSAAATTASSGQTTLSTAIIPPASTQSSINPGSSAAVTTASGGQVIASSSNGATTIISDGHTIISNSDGVLTVPTGLTTALKTTLSDGVTTTVLPTITQASLFLGSGGIIISASSGQGNFSNSSLALPTLPTGLSAPVTTTLSNGVTSTVFPQAASAQVTSFPSSSSASSTLDFPFIATSSSSTSGAAALIMPITTPVSAPTPVPGGVVVPCNFFWFFNICPHWDIGSITGWLIPFPPGIHPPGPPKITFPPGLSFSISIPLPTWPAITIPPNGIPTPESKPSDCKTETGNICFFTTSVSAVVSNQVTITTSKVQSTCADVIGCGATGSTSSTSTTATTTSPGRAPTYAIYPNDSTNSGQVKAIEDKLKTIVGDPSLVQATIATYYGLLFWLVPLNDTAAKAAGAIQNVGTFWRACGTTCPNDDSCYIPCYDPLTALVYDDLSWRTARDFNLQGESIRQVTYQMTYLSDAAPLLGMKKGERIEQFIFDQSAGSGIDVYILDTGATLSHPEFDYLRGRVRWLPGDLADAEKNDATNGKDTGYHGTAMLSLVGGKRLGIAKGVYPVIVRLPPSAPGTVFTPQDWITGLARINADLGNDLPQPQAARAVVLLAAIYPRDPSTSANYGFVKQMRDLITSIIRKGGIVVTGSGNDDIGTKIDGYPANFGKRTLPEMDPIPELIVAGAVSGDGRLTAHASDPANGIPHVYAPGLSVIVAYGDPRHITDFPYGPSGGTSDAAAYTAGLAAYYIGLARVGALKSISGAIVPNTPQAIKAFIVNKATDNPPGTAWSRQPINDEDRPGIWNYADPTKPRCAYNPDQNGQQVRRDTAAACISDTGSTISTSSSSAQSSIQATTLLPTSTIIPATSTSARSIDGAVVGGNVVNILGASKSIVAATSTSARSTDAAIAGGNIASAVVAVASALSLVQSTTAPPPTPATPLQINPVVCNHEADFPGHGDIHESDLIFKANSVCDDWDNRNFSPHDTALSRTYTIIGVQYQFDIARIDNCVTTVAFQNVNHPLGPTDPTSPNCVTIFLSCWEKCNNGGVGGSVDVGCLRYTFTGK